MASHLHPAVTVTNIRTYIPITLDIETGHYITWSELFKIHCKSFQVFDHLQPRVTSASPSSDKDKEKETPPIATWERLDSIVLQWIYGTISTDLLHTILKPNTTAYDAWTALSNLYQDNKATRTIDLNIRFTTTRLEQFSSMSSYCQAMKVIFDQLVNIGSTITDDQLVLQILTGLPEQYESVALVLSRTKPLPSFFETRSQLCMTEAQKNTQAKQAAQVAGTALTTTMDRTNTSRSMDNRQGENRSESAERGRGRGRSRGRSRGRGNTSRGAGSWNSSNTQTSSQPWARYNHQSWAPWMVPPCPYPTAPRNNHSGPSVLGPRPAQGYAATQAQSTVDGYTPTDLTQALHHMALNPSDSHWTMDTGPQDPHPYPPMQ